MFLTTAGLWWKLSLPPKLWAWYSESHTSSGSACPQLCPILFSGPVSFALGLFLQDLDECQTLGMLHNSDLDSLTLLGEKLSLNLDWNYMQCYGRSFLIQKKSSLAVRDICFLIWLRLSGLKGSYAFTEDECLFCFFFLVVALLLIHGESWVILS